MTDKKLVEAMRQRYGTPANFLRTLGLDESLLPDMRANLRDNTNRTDDDDPDDQDELGKKLAFVQSKLSNADFLKYICVLINDARQSGTEGEDRRKAARDGELRRGNLATGDLRRGVTHAQDGVLTDASRKTFSAMFGTDHMPGVC